VNGEDAIPVPTWRVAELLHDLGVIEDWLLHAGEETLAELAEFAFGARGYSAGCIAELIDELGWHGVALRDLLTAHTGQR
jgi:hypothetical protein